MLFLNMTAYHRHYSLKYKYKMKMKIKRKSIYAFLISTAVIFSAAAGKDFYTGDNWTSGYTAETQGTTQLTLEQAKSTDAPQVLFGVISDVHLTGDGTDSQRQSNLSAALNYYKQQGVSLIVENGDISQQGQTASYAEFKSIFSEVFPDDKSAPQLLVTADNHEYYQSWSWQTDLESESVPELQQRFEDAFGLTSANNALIINGYHFIAVSSDGMNGTRAIYSDETKAWLREQLKKAKNEDAEKPIYVFVHQPPENTVYASNNPCDSSDELNSLFADFPQAVVFTSHTHAPLQDERSIYQKDYTVINTGGLYYAGSEELTYANAENNLIPDCFDFAQGLLALACGNTTCVRRYDFFHQVKIKNDWFIQNPTNLSDCGYTDARAASRSAPVFPSGAALTVKRISSTSCLLSFPAASHEDFVHHYVVRAIDMVTGTVVKTSYFISDFYLGLDNMSPNVSLNLTELPSGLDLMITVAAVESFGKESTPISAEIPAA